MYASSGTSGSCSLISTHQASIMSINAGLVDMKDTTHGTEKLPKNTFPTLCYMLSCKPACAPFWYLWFYRFSKTSENIAWSCCLNYPYMADRHSTRLLWDSVPSSYWLVEWRLPLISCSRAAVFFCCCFDVQCSTPSSITALLILLDQSQQR